MKLLPTLGSDMRGSAAGITASKNRGGLYFRARRVPSKPNTANQQAIKTSLSALSSYWSTTLTATQQAGWNLYGKTNPVKNNLGMAIILSGFQMFMRLNVPLYAAGGSAAIVASAPGAVPFLGAPQFGSATAVSAATGPSAVINTVANLTTNDYLFLYITRPNSVGKVAAHQAFRLVAAHKVTMMESAMKTITIAASDPFSGRLVGSQCILKVVWVSGSNLSAYGLLTLATTS